MTDASVPSAVECLLADALLAVEHALALLRADTEPVPFFGPSDLAPLSPEKQESLQAMEADSYRRQPDQSALDFCLSAAGALLGVSQVILARQTDASPHTRAREWREIATQTKLAGRAAYRAALILSDGQPIPVPTSMQLG